MSDSILRYIEVGSSLNPRSQLNKLSGFICKTLFLIILIFCFSENLAALTNNILPDDTSKSVVDKVKDYSQKDNFLSKFLRTIIVKDDEPQSENKTHDSDLKKIRKYTGRIIRKINIVVLDVFGASVNNPKDTIRSWLQDEGNSLHMKTKEWLIKNKLIFSEGQFFLPFDIQESERIIRKTSYVYDVRIIPQDIKNDADSVDVMVYVQDIWSTNGSIAYHSGSKSGAFSVDDINLLGFGNEFKGGLKFDPALKQGWDWNSSYSVDNIEKTFLSTNFYYQSDIDRQQYGLMVGRDFISPIITWAGAIAQSWQVTRYPDLRNSLGLFENAKYNQQDYWLGYAFDLKPFDPNTVYQNRFNIAGRITRTVYSQRPEFDTTDIFQNSTFYLARIGYSYRTFYQDSYIFGLGKTEDIPLINMAALLFGFEKGSNSSRPYFGLQTGYSFYNDNFGYFYGGFQAGAFRSNDKWLDRTSILEMLYFSDLNKIGEFKWRHYIGSRYSYSYDPIRPLDILDLSNEDGLRGFSNSYLIGDKKLVVNYEADIFVPLKFVGFSLAVITFADFGLISSFNSSLSNSMLYQGYGFGIRIRNEHLIFPTFQFMFGFYPNLPQSGGEHFNMFNQSSMYYQFNQFQFSAPSVVVVR